MNFLKKYLLEDNQGQYRSYEDDWMHKLIQMEGNKFH